MTIAYCAASFKKSVRIAAGVKPLLSPPLTAETFDPKQLEGHGFLYFKLHGLADQPYWYGDNWLTALTADQLKSVDLGGALVFVANCYLPESPMLAALLDANAGHVIGGEGQNYAKSDEIAGADRLGRLIRWYTQIGFRPETAMRVARKHIKRRLKRRESQADADALAFKLYKPSDGQIIT